MQLNQYTWDKNDLLGAGSQGKVYKAFDAKKCEDVALKIFNIPFDDTHNNRTNGYTDLKHVNIIGFRELLTIYQRKVDGVACFPVLVMDYANDGNIKTYLMKHQSLGLKNDLIIQLIEGMKFLHEKNYIHGDLKPHNILVNTTILTGSTRTEVKIVDFENAIDLDYLKDHTYIPEIGSFYYTSPERYKDRFANPFPYKASDVWSLSVVVYELLKGKLPFGQGTTNIDAIKKSILHDEPDLSILPHMYGIKELIKSGLDKKPENRPSIDEFLEKFMLVSEETILVTNDEPLNPITIPSNWDEITKKRYQIIDKALSILVKKKNLIVEPQNIKKVKWSIYTKKHYTREGDFYTLSLDDNYYTIEHSADSHGAGIWNWFSHHSRFPIRNSFDEIDEVEYLIEGLNYIIDNFPPNQYYLT